MGGPISLALSAEHRKEAAEDFPDPISLVAGWHSGNHQYLKASTEVSEAAVETLIPLLKDKPFAEMWDLSAAYRFTGLQDLRESEHLEVRHDLDARVSSAFPRHCLA